MEELFIGQLGDIRHTLADNSLARELLGWSPGVKIEEGINELKGWLGLK
jgi:nucleoside-diphosphate-sugar epimerase